MNEEQTDIAKQVRALVRSLTESGADPSDISFVLCMIATELGLEMTEGSISVFPVVLSGISYAVADAVEAAETQSEETSPAAAPLGSTVH